MSENAQQLVSVAHWLTETICKQSLANSRLQFCADCLNLRLYVIDQFFDSVHRLLPTFSLHRRASIHADDHLAALLSRHLRELNRVWTNEFIAQLFPIKERLALVIFQLQLLRVDWRGIKVSSDKNCSGDCKASQINQFLSDEILQVLRNGKSNLLLLIAVEEYSRFPLRSLGVLCRHLKQVARRCIMKHKVMHSKVFKTAQSLIKA